MQRNRILFLAIVLVCSALIYSATGAFALGAGLKTAWNTLPGPAVQQYTITGVIQAKNGNIWTVDGKNYEVDPLTVSGGPTNIGDSITLTVSAAPVAPAVPQVATPSATPGATAEAMDDREISGVVTAIDASSITVDGVVYNLSPKSEMSAGIMVGDTVKLEYSTAADGTFIVYEVESFKYEDSSGTEMSSPDEDKYDDKDDDDQGSAPGMTAPQVQNGSGYYDDDHDEDHDEDHGSNHSGGGDHEGGSSEDDD